MTETTVQAPLRYLVYTGEKPIYVASKGGADAQLDIRADFETHSVTLHNARLRSPAPALDQQGFELRRHPTGIADFYDDRERWIDDYEREIEALLLEATGAEAVHIFDHTLRSDSSGVRGDRDSREPATVIHNDYTDASAARRVRDLLPENQAAHWLAGRYAIVNTWRSVAGPVLTTPLACCDATTLATGDLVASERRAEERAGELELVSWNPDHRWYYYPAMERDEVLLIKTFDSALDGRARRSIHSAFDNPLAEANAPPRESIESRALIYFGTTG